MLILFIFLTELAAAILAFLFREHVSMSHFLLGLRPSLLIMCHVMLLLNDTSCTGDVLADGQTCSTSSKCVYLRLC